MLWVCYSWCLIFCVVIPYNYVVLYCICLSLLIYNCVVLIRFNLFCYNCETNAIYGKGLPMNMILVFFSVANCMCNLPKIVVSILVHLCINMIHNMFCTLWNPICESRHMYATQCCQSNVFQYLFWQFIYKFNPFCYCQYFWILRFSDSF